MNITHQLIQWSWWVKDDPEHDAILLYNSSQALVVKFVALMNSNGESMNCDGEEFDE